MISEFLGRTNPAGRHSLTILLLFVFNLLLFWISGSGITFWSYSRDADLVWNCHCNCSITSKKWFTFWTPWKSSRFACSAMTMANISWVNFRFRFRKNIPTAVWRFFFIILFFFNSITGVEDLLQKHSLVEADINVLGERVKQVVQHSQRFLEEEAVEGYQPCDPSIIVDRVSGNYLYSV